MDFDALATGVGIVSQIFSIFKSAKDLLPADRREEVAGLIDRAEKEFQIFEASAAKKFDYHLCKCGFPPGIMVLVPGRDDAYKCPKCGRVADYSSLYEASVKPF